MDIVWLFPGVKAEVLKEETEWKRGSGMTGILGKDQVEEYIYIFEKVHVMLEYHSIFEKLKKVPLFSQTNYNAQLREIFMG